MSKRERFRAAVQAECQRLFDLTGVPVGAGSYSLTEGYFRYDFNEPLGEGEIDEISRAYGVRFISIFNNQQAYITI